MVQDPEVDGAGGVHQGSGEVLILRGWLGITAGVIVDEDDPGRMPGQGRLHNTAGVNNRPVHRSFLHNLMIQNPVLGIQKNDHEGFMGQARQLHPGEVQEGGRP